MERIWSDEKFWSEVLLLNYNVSVNKSGVKCGTSLRIWENEGWINEKILMDRFSGILDTG